MPTGQRFYTVKDVEMLVAASTIVDNAICHKKFLQSKRSTWKDPFFDDLKKKIDEAISLYLGIDSARELRKATQGVVTNLKAAAVLVAEVKVQVEEDFKGIPYRRDEILNDLGFTSHYKKAKAGNQEAMMELLDCFSKNLKAEMRAEIIEKGTAPETLDEIIDYAEVLKNARAVQESHKAGKKNMNAEAVDAFNEIYSSITRICVISRKFFVGQPEIQDQFNFNKIVRLQSLKPKAIKSITLSHG